MEWETVTRRDLWLILCHKPRLRQLQMETAGIFFVLILVACVQSLFKTQRRIFLVVLTVDRSIASTCYLTFRLL